MLEVDTPIFRDVVGKKLLLLKEVEQGVGVRG
jgi:hypothetical protein